MNHTPTTRVLVVDDSVIVRRVVTNAFEHVSGIEVIGAARDGQDALAKIESLKPDVVILDLEMPVMDGFEALAEIRRRDADLPVIIYSHLTSASAEATLEALALGATDFALKPSSGGIGLPQDRVRDELLPLIAGLGLHSASPRAARAAPTGAAAPAVTPWTHRPQTRVDAIVVAVSTGGPNALMEIVSHLPADLPVPLIIVQHMPPMFTGMLAERLDRGSKLEVVEAAAGDLVEPGMAYIAPGGLHMAIERSAGTVNVVLDDGPAENSHRPAGDVLFRAAATVYGANTLAYVLTGMGQDGLRGSELIRAAGGVVVAQSEATCVSSRMPAAVIEAGITDAVVDLDGIAGTMIARSAKGR